MKCHIQNLFSIDGSQAFTLFTYFMKILLLMEQRRNYAKCTYNDILFLVIYVSVIKVQQKYSQFAIYYINNSLYMYFAFQRHNIKFILFVHVQGFLSNS